MFADLVVGLFADWLFQVAAKLVAHRRQKLVLEISVAARAEPFVERGRQYRGRRALIDGRLDRPAAFAGIGHAASKLGQRRVRLQSGRGQVKEP